MENLHSRLYRFQRKSEEFRGHFASHITMELLAGENIPEAERPLELGLWSFITCALPFLRLCKVEW